MCYDSQSSMRTFLFGLGVSVFLWYRNYPVDRFIAFTWLSVVIMQLSEYFMWKDQECGEVNRYSTVISLIILIIQPLFYMIGLKFLTENSISPVLLNSLVIFVVILCFVNIGYVLFKKKDFPICSTPGKNRHLIWDTDKITNQIPPGIKYTFASIYWAAPFLILFVKQKVMGIVYLILFYGSQLLSYYINKDSGMEWKSFWCHTINYTMLLPIIVGYLYANKKLG